MTGVIKNEFHAFWQNMESIPLLRIGRACEGPSLEEVILECVGSVLLCQSKGP